MLSDVPLEATPQLPGIASRQFGSVCTPRAPEEFVITDTVPWQLTGPGELSRRPSEQLFPSELKGGSSPAQLSEADQAANLGHVETGCCTGEFKLEKAWQHNKCFTHSSELTRASFRGLALQLQSSEGETRSIRPFQVRSAIHPEARLRLCWVFIGALMLAYDMVVLPLQLAGLAPEDLEHEAWQWVSLAYWTIDLPVNFLTGFYKDGVIELRLSHTAACYLRGWFFNDAMIISVDSCITILNTATDRLSGDSPQIVRLVRSARLLRSMRLLRMMRFRRFMEIARRVLDSCGSQVGVMVARVIGLLVCIMMLNHTIACLWYYIGTSAADPSESWLRLTESAEEDQRYAYVCAFHWAITQFTPATQNISPTTPPERLFASIVVLIALVTFSTFLGKMTSAMTQLLNLNAGRFQKEATLRQFLAEHKISVSLAQHIWQVYRQQQQTHAQKHKATLLEVKQIMSLPTDMLKVLCVELYQKRLLELPILKKALRLNSSEARDLCLVFEERAGAPAKEVFPSGQAASSALCVTYGQLIYSSRRLVVDVEVVPGAWVSEAALWGQWKRCGTLTTVSVCRWLVMEREAFQNIIINMYTTSRLRQILSKYTELFAREVVQHDWLDFAVDACELDGQEAIIHDAVVAVCGSDWLSDPPARRSKFVVLRGKSKPSNGSTAEDFRRETSACEAEIVVQEREGRASESRP